MPPAISTSTEVYSNSRVPAELSHFEQRSHQLAFHIRKSVLDSQTFLKTHADAGNHEEAYG